MGWHFQAKRFKTEHKEWVGIVEVYPDLRLYAAKGIPHTENEVTISAESKSELIKWLEQAIKDIEEHDVIED